MNDIDMQATLRVQKARAELIQARRFYGVLVSNVEPVLSRSVPTMATNSKQHFFNPEFIMGLKKNRKGLEVAPQKLVLGVQAHETEHDARHHSTRRAWRDQKKWNEACDFAINPDLEAEGFDLPEGAYFDKRFAGMSAEDIYRTRELDEQNKDKPASQQPEPEQPEEGEQEEGESEPEEQEGESEGEEPEQEPEGEEGEAEGEGEGNPQNLQGEKGEDGEGEAQGEAQGEGEGQAEGEAQGQGEPTSCGDPGQCGEVLDAAESAAETSEQDQKWERLVRQAASMAKKAGQLPGHISRDLERANNPPQDWREVLRAWFDQGSLLTESWNRPNRRFVGQGLYLPGREKEGINKVVYIIDTSGSMDEVALACIKNETQAALDDGAIDEVVVIYGDTRVTRVDTWRTGDEMEFDPRGGGGTVLLPLFEHVEQEVSDASLIVCFTDGYIDINSESPEPHCPVLFAFTGYPEEVRNMIANAPWGSPAIDVGEH